MNDSIDLGVIHVENVNLWAHVGVLDKERLLGQDFLVDFSIWVDIEDASKNDNLSSTVDYSLAIKGLQKLAFQARFFTIERFSDHLLDYLESLYGPLPMRLFLRKCAPPVEGFSGSVGIERKRNFNF